MRRVVALIRQRKPAGNALPECGNGFSHKSEKEVAKCGVVK
jgi:hypothetical protein